MPDLNFKIIGAEGKEFALVPTLNFKLQVHNAEPDEEVYSAALKAQVMIEAIHRDYDPDTQERLVEVFGEPSRWDQTLNSLLWTTVTVPLPRFLGTTVVDVPLACSADLEVAAGKYFWAIRDGIVPLSFLFSGTIFYKGPASALQVTQLPWEKEAQYALPVKLWRDLMDRYHPHSTWLRVRQETFDKLYQFKAQNALPTLDDCLDLLVEQCAGLVKKS